MAFGSLNHPLFYISNIRGMVIHNVILITDSSRTGDNFGICILDFSASERETHQTYIGCYTSRTGLLANIKTFSLRSVFEHLIH